MNSEVSTFEGEIPANLILQTVADAVIDQAQVLNHSQVLEQLQVVSNSQIIGPAQVTWYE